MDDEVAGTVLATNALLSALMKRLVANGVLSDDDGVDVFVQALTMVETSQEASPHIQAVHRIARQILEKGFSPRS